MTARRVIRYTYLPWDKSLDDVCARLQTNVATVRDLTAAESSEGNYGAMSEDQFRKVVGPGFVLFTMYPGDPWEWQPTTIDGKLGDFISADSENPGRRAGGPPLDPKLLFFHIINEPFRRIYLTSKNDGQRQAIEADPGTLDLGGGQLMIPYPIRAAGTKVSVTAAKDGKPSGSLAMHPDWIAEVDGWCERVKVLTAAVNFFATRAEGAMRDGIAACSQLAILQRLVALQIKGSPSTSELKDLETKLAALYTRAVELLHPPSWGELKFAWVQPFKDDAKQLLALVENDKAAALFEKANAAPNERINGSSALLKMLDTSAKAMCALARSPEASSALDTIQGALDDSGSSVLAKLVGAATSVTATSFGNLPGPETIAVGLIHWHAAGRFADAAKGNQRTLIESIQQSLKRHCALTQEEAEWVKAIAPPAAMQKDIDSAAREIGNRIISENPTPAMRLQAGRVISGLTTILNFAGMLAAMEADTGGDHLSYAIFVSNITGSSMNTALGAYQWLGVFSETGPYAVKLASLGKCFGVAASGLMIVTGVLTVFTETDTLSKISGGLQAVGGAVSLAGMLMISPGTQIVGGVIIVASVAVAIYPTIRDLMLPGPKKILLAQLNYFKDRPAVAATMVKVPELQTLFTAVTDRINDGDHAGLYEFAPAGGAEKDLKALGFNQEDVGSMIKSPSPKYVRT